MRLKWSPDSLLKILHLRPGPSPGRRLPAISFIPPFILIASLFLLPSIVLAAGELEKIQYLSGGDYTRVVLYTNAPVVFEEHAVQADPGTGAPAQVFLDLKDCVIGPQAASRLRVKDTLLKAVKVKKLQKGRIRVVVEAQSINGYRVFSIPDPFRVIVDVRGKEHRVVEAEPQRTPPTVEPEPQGSPPIVEAEPQSIHPSAEAEPLRNPPAPDGSLPSIARQLSLDVKRIVIDPGHGGKDKGAIGPDNIYEKDVVLILAKALKKVLEKDLSCEVTLTRTRDRFIPLEERTAIANAQKADLFISLHTNAHTDRSACGTETYFLDISKDNESARVAAAENATSTKRIGDLETILHDLMLNTKVKESAQLACEVQHGIITDLKKQHYENVRDLGTKQAPFCVLLGAEMPSILVETAFISNDREERLLKDKQFQDRLVRGIANGIESYIRQVKGLARAGDYK